MRRRSNVGASLLAKAAVAIAQGQALPPTGTTPPVFRL
ncbi:hypothetical protein PG5_19890 [Pseudomonas sp. G5(2012)]|nr:hypothetical protein PG5_19890 [Pseudomonas sp. G5(2012)]